MKNFFSTCFLAALSLGGLVREKLSDPLKEKPAFQISSHWMPEIDVRSDIAIVYGVNDRPGMTFEQRAQSWLSNQLYDRHSLGRLQRLIVASKIS